MRILYIIIIFVGWSSSAWAQTRSLDYYVSRAIQNSPVITAQKNSADSVRLQKKIIHADSDLPLITASGDYEYAPVGDHFGYDEAITDGGHYDALLNASYPLFSGKKKRVRLHASSVAIKQTAHQIKQTRHQLRYAVTGQYITTYQDLMRLHYANDVFNVLNRQKNILNDLAKQGAVQIVDLKQFNIQLQNSRLIRQTAQSRYAQDLLQLNAQAGIPDSTTSLQLSEPVIAVDTQLVKQSHFMNQYKLDSLQTAAQQSISELKYQPDISLGGNTGLNTIQFTGLQNQFGYSVGLHVSVPIFDGNQRSITRRQSRLQQHSIDAYQQRFKTRRSLQLTSLWNQLKQNKAQLELLSSEISQYKELLNDYHKEIAGGIVSVVNYLTVFRNYNDALQKQVETLGNQLQLKNEYNYWNW